MSETSQDGKFDSTIGGAALRLGEGPDGLGVLDAPNTPMPIRMAFGAVRTAEGLALFRLVIGQVDLPGRWVCRARRFVLVE
jgi:hypothetical protein